MKHIIAYCVVASIPWLLPSFSIAANHSSVNWIEEKNPLGFSLKHPKGWQVNTNSDGFIRIQKGDTNLFVLIAPFIAKPDQTSIDTLTRLSTILKTDFSRSKLLKFESLHEQPDEAIGTYSFSQKGEQGKANVLCSIENQSGMLYAIAAPSDQFEDQKETLIAIVKSLVFTEPSEPMKENQSPKTEELPTLQYVRWEDPREKAFSLEVPKGWKINGGLFRFASVDVRSCVELTSPNEKIRITGGDQEIPTFSLPMSSFFPEGSWYSPGYGVNMIVMHYLTGLEFAQEYVQKRKESILSNIQFTETKDRPDIAQTLNSFNAVQNLAGISQIMTAGEVAFTAQMDQQNVKGYYFAASTKITYPAGMSEGGIWLVPYLHGFIATEDQVAVAQEVLQHGIQSILINPQWVSMQQGITSETSKIVSRTNEEISNIISESYWNRQASQDDLSRKWSNTILGQTDLVDPDSGETFKSSSGHNYYWRKQNSNEIAGTDTYERPDIDFAPLQEW